MNDLKKKLKDIEDNIELQLNNKFVEIENKMNFINNLIDALKYKKEENIYFKSKLTNSSINNNNFIFNDIIFKRQVYIYSKIKNRYLLMTNEGKVIQSDKKSKWEVQIKFSDKSIIFYSNNLYLKEINGNIEGSKDLEKWIFEIKNKSDYYFKYPKRLNNNIMSVESEEIKANKVLVGNYELFKLVDAFDNNIDEFDKTNSYFSLQIKDLQNSISI